MSQTQFRGTQVNDRTITRDDLDVATAGKAVVRKIIAGSGVSLVFTGVDSGTGDVTITATGGGGSGITFGQGIAQQRQRFM